MERRTNNATATVNSSKAIVSILLILALSHLTLAQQLQTVTGPQSSNDHIRRIIVSLEQDNILRIALERGDRGNGMHRAWMDEMKRQGVKQASYRIRFVSGPNYKKLDIQDTTYLSQYYRFDSKISDRATVNQITQSGLEKTLRAEILLRARRNLNQRVRVLHSTWLCGVLYLNLLDDETLPILDEPAYVYRTNKGDCRRYL